MAAKQTESLLVRFWPGRRSCLPTLNGAGDDQLRGIVVLAAAGTFFVRADKPEVQTDRAEEKAAVA